LTFIKTISPGDAEGRLKKLYDRIKAPDGRIDNILCAHSLRPHTLEGHMALYKNVLHHSANQIPKWFLEAIGVYVSIVNRCDYCVDHHFEGMNRLLNNQDKAGAVKEALIESLGTGVIKCPALTKREISALSYAAVLTKAPSSIMESQINELRNAGWTDGQILEINQVASYFAYANRTVLGLGVTTDGDLLGLSPGNSDDEDDWSHR
jgi:uncharacterized peroxidase-related enzyme